MAKVLAKELEPYHLMFIEEPVLPQNNEALREIARYTATPIATGERMFSRWEFKDLLMDGYVDIIQPDLSHAGGRTEVKKIAAMAEAERCSCSGEEGAKASASEEGRERASGPPDLPQG